MKHPRVVLTALSLSAAAFGSLVLHEGFSPVAYIPVPGDVPTIGFGTTSGVRPGDTITAPSAVLRALQDVSRFEGALKTCVTVPLAQHEYDAYISLAYNIGSGAFCGSTLVKLLNQGQYRAACDQILRWDKFKGQPLRGLTLRRQDEHRKCIGEGA
jgi:lysozyme